MKDLKIRSMVIVLCASLMLTVGGCSKAEEKTDATTTTAEETTTTTTAEETTTSATEAATYESTASGDLAELCSTPAADMVSSSSVEDIRHQCEAAGMSVMPIEELGELADYGVVEGFAAVSVGGFDISDLQFSGELPEGFEEDLEALEDYLQTGEIPEGYEDIFSDFEDFEDFEGFDDFDFSSYTDPASPTFYYSTDADGVEAGLLADSSTVICLQFGSYDEAIAFLDNEYDTVEIEETADGCVFSSSYEDMGVTLTTDGAVSSDGLLYMRATSGL